jgi:hypothetical protein
LISETEKEFNQLMKWIKENNGIISIPKNRNEYAKTLFTLLDIIII